MLRAKSVEEYIEANESWKSELETLRQIMRNTALHEEIKWGAPIYTLKGRNVVGMAAFKSFVSLWFHQGVFLSDPAAVLVNAAEGVTRGLRQWRFSAADQMDTKLILSYVAEAIENARQGKEIRPQPKTMMMAEELDQALRGDSVLKLAFEALTSGRQKEYAEYISSAKQDATRITRLKKCIPMILAGIGLTDKYKK